MNKIYKVIWSKAKNCYVVVSEIAKRNSKRSSGVVGSVVRSALTGAVFLSLTAGMCAPAWAEAIMQGQDNTVVGDTGSAWGSGNFVAGATTEDGDLVDPDGLTYFLDNNKIVTLSAQGSDFQNHNYILYKGVNGNPLAIVDGVVRPVTYEQYNKQIRTWETTTETIETTDISTLPKYDNGTAFGSGNTAVGEAATAFGINTLAKGPDSTTFGHNTNAIGGGATAFGSNTKAAGYVTDKNGYIKTEDSNVFTTLDGKVAYSNGDTTYKVAENGISYVVYKGADGTPFAEIRDQNGNKTKYKVNTSEDGTAEFALDANGAKIPTYTSAINYTDGKEIIRVNESINSTAFGSNTLASEDESTAFGNGTIASGRQSTAFGNGSIANGYQSATAFGQNSTASGHTAATAFGVGTVASGYQGATAFGKNTVASGTVSTAWGEDSVASAQHSTAFGHHSEASGNYSTAWGENTVAKTQYTTAFGQNTTASGNNATAFGADTVAQGGYSLAFGNGSNAGGLVETETKTVTVNGYNGDTTITYTSPQKTQSGFVFKEDQSGQTAGADFYTTAFGHNTVAAVQGSTAFGDTTYAGGMNATAFGLNTVAVGNQSLAFGDSTYASHFSSVAFGTNTYALNNYALAGGQNSKAIGQHTFAFGLGAQATNERSIAIGGNALSSGMDAVAMGNGAEARGNSSFATPGAVASVDNSVALGNGSFAGAYNGNRGYNPSTDSRTIIDTSDHVWKPTANNVSVGDVQYDGEGNVTNRVTRRITGLAAGYYDTDAVNVAQLKKVVGGAVGDASLKFGGDDAKDDDGSDTDTKVITKNNGQRLDIVGGAENLDTLTDKNIGVVYDETTKEQPGLHIKLAKDIDLGDTGSITIGDTIIDNDSVTTNNITAVENITTPQITLGNTTNNTMITYDGDRINYKQGDTTYKIANTEDVTWNAYVNSVSDDNKAGTVDIANPNFTFKAGDNVTITTDKDNSIKISATPDLSDVGLKFGGDDAKDDDGSDTDTKVITKNNGQRLDIVGGAENLDTLTDKNIGVVYDETTKEQPGLHIKLAKDIDLGDTGSITIGDTIIDNDSVTTNNITAVENITTPQITLGNTTNNTMITYDGDRINYKQGDTTYKIANTEDVTWNAYVNSVSDDNKAGTVDIANPNFTFKAGDNVTITTDKDNSIKISATAGSSIGIEAGDGITISKDKTTNKYKISLNIEGGVTPTDTVTVEPKSSTGGESTNPGTTGGDTSGSGTTENNTEAGNPVVIESDTNSTAFTDDGGTTFVTVKPTSVDDDTSGENNLQIKGDGKNISTVATSNGQDKGGSIEVKLKDDITVKNVTVNNTIKVGGDTTITGDTITTKNIEGDNITGDTINATTVNATTINGDTVNTQEINLGDTTITEGDDNRITYNTKSGDTYNIATLEDGMDFAGDDGKAIHKNLAEQLDVVGGAKDKASEYNIYTYNDGDKLRINLAKDIDGVDSITVNKTINVGGDTTITGDTITTKTFVAGDTTINNDGLKIKNGPSVTKNGVDAGGKKITNVAPGEDGTDAVNVDQLNDAISQVGGDAINRLGDQVNHIDNRMKKGLAGAAALAALHPLDFDPDDKLTFAAGVGNYRGENAAAVGAFYRPDEKTMLSVGGTFGNGENMVNAGISFSLDRVAHVTNSKTAMAREILDLRRELTELKASMASGNWMLDPSLTRLFPDTEENHWAYEYVKTLAGNHIIEGYPDGEFKGERMITRYEMAAILYRAMMNGAKLPDKALNEFAPELGRFRVDRVYGNGDARHKVERIRVNDENRKERDVYGSEYNYFKANPGANVSTGALPGTRQAERVAKAEAAAKQSEKPSIVSDSEVAAG